MNDSKVLAKVWAKCRLSMRKMQWNLFEICDNSSWTSNDFYRTWTFRQKYKISIKRPSLKKAQLTTSTGFLPERPHLSSLNFIIIFDNNKPEGSPQSSSVRSSIWLEKVERFAINRQPSKQTVSQSAVCGLQWLTDNKQRAEKARTDNEQAIE